MLINVIIISIIFVAAITCANQPCQNGATCYNAGSSYFCYCGTGSNYTGKNCDTAIVSSDSSRNFIFF
jgi:hypothetical protein